jgi:hypothetical protein
MGGGMTAADKKSMIMKMQSLMIEIVDLDKDLSDENPKQTNLSSPLLSDGFWGKNTDESYKSILAKHNERKSDPKNMDEALKLLGQIKTSLAIAKNGRDAEEVAKNQAQVPTKPNPAPAINDDQAKAAFRGLLESIQSGRIKLKAGSNTNEFRQRIGRDWGAIIRAYNGPQGVVDAFYAGLALTEDEKTQLVNINKEGLGGTSSVVGKINQKFLEAINTYIKPFGRALRTEKGMARVIDRRQERQERKQNKANAALKDLWILSKVAQRKEVARERLEKTAQSKYQSCLNEENLTSMINFVSVKRAKILDPNELASAKTIALDCFVNIKNSLARDCNFYKNNGDSKNYYNDKDLISLYDDIINFLNFDTSIYTVKKTNESDKNFYGNLILNLETKLRENLLYVRNKNLGTSGSSTENSNATKANPAPKQAPRRPTTDLTELRNLLAKAGYKIGEGEGWAPLEAPFRAAVKDFARTFSPAKVLYEGWSWGSVAKETFGMSPNISGAEQLVSDLIERQKAAQQAAAGEIPAAAPAPVEESIDNNKVVEGLKFLFDKILSGEVKVDKAGPDFKRDSKNFRGIIRGLGGTNGAALYCVEKCGFISEENKEIINYTNLDITTLGGKVDRSSVLRKIYNQFMLIMREARRGVGRDNRGITEEQLNRSVSRVMRERASEPKKAASISKSIEIRKAAARKKLGLQS